MGCLVSLACSEIMAFSALPSASMACFWLASSLIRCHRPSQRVHTLSLPAADTPSATAAAVSSSLCREWRSRSVRGPGRTAWYLCASPEVTSATETHGQIHWVPSSSPELDCFSKKAFPFLIFENQTQVTLTEWSLGSRLTIFISAISLNPQCYNLKALLMPLLQSICPPV